MMETGGLEDVPLWNATHKVTEHLVPACSEEEHVIIIYVIIRVLQFAPGFGSIYDVFQFLGAGGGAGLQVRRVLLGDHVESAVWGPDARCEKIAFLAPFQCKLVNLPRQARDKHREKLQKQARFVQAIRTATGTMRRRRGTAAAMRRRLAAYVQNYLPPTFC